MSRIYSLEEEDYPLIIHTSTSRSQKLRSVLIESEIKSSSPFFLDPEGLETNQPRGVGILWGGAPQRVIFWGIFSVREGRGYVKGINASHRKRTSKDKKKDQ